MAHVDHLMSFLHLEGLHVVDVGAGDGNFSRQMDAAGAKVTAIEIDSGKVAKAKKNLPSSIIFELGAAEDLPVKTGSQDLVCMFFSLHHVPSHLQPAAFSEVRRVLRRKGRLHIVEPYPYGTMFDVVRWVEDETVVRTNSHNLLNELAGENGIILQDKREYILTREFPTFENFLERIVLPDPDRTRAYEAVPDEMADAFLQSVEAIDGQVVLHQPCAAYHFLVSS